MAMTEYTHKTDIPSEKRNIFAFVYATLMYSRLNHLSAFQRLVSVVLHCGHATEEVVD